jgi:hypothetical protein
MIEPGLLPKIRLMEQRKTPNCHPSWRGLTVMTFSATERTPQELYFPTYGMPAGLTCPRRTARPSCSLININRSGNINCPKIRQTFDYTGKVEDVNILFNLSVLFQEHVSA